MKCISTQPYTFLHASLIYMCPLNTQRHTSFTSIFHIHPTVWIWKSQRRSVAGGRDWGAIFDMGHGARRHKAPFPAPPCGKWQERARGGGGRKQKKKKRKKRRKEEEAVRERQLVGSANHQGNTHLIDMWNLNSSYKLIGSTTMDQSSKRQLRAGAKDFVGSSSVVGWKGCLQGDYNQLCSWPF